MTSVMDNPESARCRFLACHGQKLFISDLGNHLVYAMDLSKTDGFKIKEFGKFGKRPGEWIEPAGIAVDAKGTMVIVDAG